ncbi:NEDD4-binding protein 1-like [Neodiprion virginianus]|uniref:NEDD4-binding protein 1-like n=1 Tax=Neodiprion virginianus TaxID=2961670 RepID=UPI001EE70E54|nr:NEDD4-binding protein 1-like [Neodiprion virginianus]XP_046619520.1 NEDD4-binding protein 1-like [Neodiprion virginianus]XP_046619521.1 NEDD4-binding protein 1-like [Neodiprion virginianus]XP_046619522.1 NEDD4-binding protein 1-like [Neodiprion virginianus]XP_046619523.1 NEDD4-binding protein 1-like [Neodiprion virginianus]XP_046619524.1 NEDD4-binding protein 1-like [Neodiprion virginianus]
MDNMPNKQNANVKDSTSVIKLDVSPRKEPIQKRQRDSSLALKPSAKRQKFNNRTYYESPLKHLGKSIDRTNSAVSLDESVVVIEDNTDFQASKSSASAKSNSTQLTCPDDSIIILSDNEEISEKQINIEKRNRRIIHDQDSSTVNAQVSEVASVEKRTIKKKNRFQSRITSRKAKYGAKTIVRKVNCQKKEDLMPKMQPISIDSEDENIIPNDDTTKSQAKIAIDNNSESLWTSKDVSPPNFQGDVKESTKNTKTNSLRTESTIQSEATPDDVLIIWTQTERCHTGAKELPSACEEPTEEPSNLEERSGFCIDTKGDPSSLHHLNENNNKSDKTKQQLNPNWARFTKYQSSANLPVKKPNIGLHQPEVNAVGRCYTTEIVVKRPGSLRDIVIDGSNIAMAYTNHKYFSETGLKLVIDYFKLRGHTVKTFIPQHKRSMKHQLLEQLYSEGIVVFTPSRYIGGKRISSHDDRYILEYATMCDGIVVSLDQYRDLYAEKPEWKNTIENRLLVPTFVGKCVMFPEDPLGRRGPKLEEFLRH